MIELMWPWILILLLTVFIGFVISTLHYALRDFSMVKLDALVEKKGRKEAVDRVLDDIDGHVLATGAVRALCNVVITVACVVLFGVFAAPDETQSTIILKAWSLGGAIAGAAILIYLFGLLLPVSVAEHAGERMLFAMTSPLRLIHLLARPLHWARVVDLAVKRLAGVAHVSEAEEAEDEILSAVSEGEREGSIGEEEREMIEGVVELRSQTVEEIMTPRTEVEGFELTNDLEFIRTFIEKAGHSRIPVYEGDLDHIVGILYAKDLLRFVGKDANGFELRPILRKPVWVPETKPLHEMMVELRARKVHLAIVLDEYGGTTGLVTFEDILEEIVGDIQDEFEPTTEMPPEIRVDEDSRCAEIDARAYIDDANDALKAIGIELPEDEDYDTVGGYVLSALGHIPVAGEMLEGDGFALAVIGAEATRVTRLRIESREAASDESGSAENGSREAPKPRAEVSANKPAAQ